MIEPRATSLPRTFITYSCEPSATSSWMRTGGMTAPRSAATWRRTAPTRASSEPPRAAVDQRHEAEADGQLDGVDRQRLEGLVARRRRRGQGGRGRLLRLGRLALGQHAGDRAAGEEEEAADDDEGDLGQARDEREGGR